MYNFVKITAAVAVFSISASSIAASKVEVFPVQIGLETARFDRGEVTLDLQHKHGAIQISPLGLDHGGLTFSVAVFNDMDVPVNFDVENFSIMAGSQTLAVFTKDQLVKKAEKRAAWTQVGLAMLGGVAAAAAASQRDHYRSTFVTPHGVYQAYYSAPSVAGQIQAAASVAAAGVGIAHVQNQLDETRAQLRDEAIQRSTVDPHSSYGGRIYIEKIKAKTLPQEVRITVDWNGEPYVFAFQVAKPGSKAPSFTTLTSLRSESAPVGEAMPVEPISASTIISSAVPPVAADLKSTSDLPAKPK